MMRNFSHDLADQSANNVTLFAKKYPGLMEALDTIGLSCDRLQQDAVALQQQMAGQTFSPSTAIEINQLQELAAMLMQFREQFYLKLVHGGVRRAMVNEMQRATPPIQVVNRPLPKGQKG